MNKLFAACMIPVAVLAGSARLLAEESTRPTSDTPSAQTFTLRHLDLDEAMRVSREMTGVADLTANHDAGTIAARAPASALRQMDTLVKVFDTAQPSDSKPWKIRVFHLDHIAATQAMAILRSKLQVLEAAYAVNPQRVAVRDTEERLEQAAKLLAEADVVK